MKIKKAYFLSDLAERNEVKRALKSEIWKATENYKKAN
jgi:hypothetical protein